MTGPELSPKQQTLMADPLALSKTPEFEAAHQRYIEAKKRVDDLLPIYDAAEGAVLSRVRSELSMAVSVKNKAEDELFDIYDAQRR